MWYIKKHSREATNNQSHQNWRLLSVELNLHGMRLWLRGTLGTLVEGSGHSIYGCGIGMMYA